MAAVGFQQHRMYQRRQIAMSELDRDRLIATCSGLSHDAASRHASRMIHSPIAMISPLSSASGIKCRAR